MAITIALKNKDGWILYGDPANQSVGSKTDTNDPGTHWEVQVLEDGSYTFKCQGSGSDDDPRYLDGLTTTAGVNLAPNTGSSYSGTHWQPEALDDFMNAFKCLGNLPGSKYLAAGQSSATLAAEVNAPDEAWTMIFV